MFLSINLFSDILEDNNWYEGYYINLKSDTVKGFTQHKNKPSESIASFKYSNEKTKFLFPNQIKGYGYSNKVFESCYVFVQNIFLERVVDGKITLYKIGNSYYIKKGNSEVVKINKVFTKQIILDYIEDNPSLCALVNEWEYLLSYEIAPVIHNYNLWASSSMSVPGKNLIEPLALSTVTSVAVDTKDSIKSEPKPTINNTRFELTEQKRFTPKFNLLGIGVGIETKIGNSASIYIEGGSGFSLNFSSNEGGSLYLLPFGEFHFRVYTNLKKRQKVGKKTYGFTGDYVSPFFIYSKVVGDSRSEKFKSMFYGINYGFQKQKAKNIYWGIDIGGGLRTNVENGGTNLDYLLKLNFGFTL